MRIPLPQTPRWFDRLLDWLNIDIGPRLWKYQPRRIDVVIIIFAFVATIIDGMLFHPWSYALVMDPMLIITGIVSVIILREIW
jgi:hypothetical protein